MKKDEKKIKNLVDFKVELSFSECMSSIFHSYFSIICAKKEDLMWRKIEKV